MRVTVVIVNWNGRQLLPDCLQALRLQTRPADQIIVVDNGSSDDSLSFLRSSTDLPLTLVSLPENRGFAGGNNAAASRVTGNVVALLNNDAQPEPDWLAAALPHFADERVGMIACRIVRLADPATIDKVGHLIYPDGLNRGRGTGQPAERFKIAKEALWPDGCAGLYRRVLLDDLAWFDEDFFLYGEDADLGLRARWAGYDCRYEPRSVVRHRHSAGLGKFSPQKAYYIERNRIWVLIKNFPISWVLRSPWHTLVRYGYNAFSLLRGRGSAAGFRSEHSSLTLLTTLLRASWHGLRGCPSMWAKRKQIDRKVSTETIETLLRKFRISASEITLQD